jgi:hypothetical protein
MNYTIWMSEGLRYLQSGGGKTTEEITEDNQYKWKESGNNGIKGYSHYIKDKPKTEE